MFIPNDCHGKPPVAPPPFQTPPKHDHCHGSYPYECNGHDSYGCDPCDHRHHHPIPPPPPVKFPTSGFFQGTAFMMYNTYPYIVDTAFTKYGNFIQYSDTIVTKVTQRNDPSCINLTASFDTIESNMNNAIRVNYLEKYIGRHKDELKGALPIVKTPIKIKLYYMVNDRDGGLVRESCVEDFVYDNKFHFTSIRDVMVQSIKGVLVTNIPDMAYRGLYTITIKNVELYVGVIDTPNHMVDDMNPYYGFTDNNMRILMQHDTIESTRPDYEIMIASCEVNRSFEYHANVTTRMKISFTAFMSSFIVPGCMEGVYSALTDYSNITIEKMCKEIELLKEEVYDLRTKYLYTKESISQIHDDIDKINIAIKTNTDSIDDVMADVSKLFKDVSDITDRLDVIEDGSGSTIPIDSYTKTEIDAMFANKVDKVEGMGLSKNDYSDEEKALVHGMSAANQITFGSIIEFPTIGESNKLYIATDKYLSYIWDDDAKAYVNINKNNVDVDTIQSIISEIETNP